MRIDGSIPKGLHHAAQGCEERATLGATFLGPINPERVAAQRTTDTPSQAAMQPFQGWRIGCTFPPKVARSSQPWAERFHPVGMAAPNIGWEIREYGRLEVCATLNTYRQPRS